MSTTPIVMFMRKLTLPGKRDKVSPGSGETMAYRFAANQAICVSRRIQKSRRIYVRPWVGPTVRTYLVFGFG